MQIQNPVFTKLPVREVPPGTCFSDGVNTFLRIETIEVLTAGELVLRDVAGVGLETGGMWYVDAPKEVDSPEVIVYPDTVVTVG